MASLCVFCGSSSGVNPTIQEAGRLLGARMAAEDIELVFGGGRVGIMGVIADTVMEHGGRVKGVIPQSLMDLEVAHQGITDLIVVDTMHARKHIMYEASDAFLIFPGGIGTLDEFFEIWTWKQLKYHNKEIFVYNHEGFYDHLVAHLKHIVDQGFFSATDYSQLKVLDDLDLLWSHLRPALQSPKA